MQLIQSNNKTMSSREIAGLTGKNHAHVMRDIKAMLTDLEIDQSRFGDIFLDAYKREQPCYSLERDLTDCLLTGYSAKARMVVIKRWKELEAKQVETPEQLMARALISAQSVIDDKNQLLEQARPAIELHKSIVNDDDTLSMRDAGKGLQVKPNKFIEWLVEVRYIDYKRIAYQSKLNVGYLVLSTTEHNGRPRTNTRVTGKGFAHFGKKIAEIKFNNPSNSMFYK